MNAAVDRAEVYAGPEKAGLLLRENGGARFIYDPAYLDTAGATRGSIATSLPISEPEHIYRGANVHPYFAGLLPEGWRFNTLLSQAKASADDLFSLLLLTGADAIGDVSICKSGQTPYDLAP